MKTQFFTATIFGLGVTLGAAGAWADGTETLGPPIAIIPIATGTGIIGAGIGLRDGSGLIDID